MPRRRGPLSTINSPGIFTNKRDVGHPLVTLERMTIVTNNFSAVDANYSIGLIVMKAAALLLLGFAPLTGLAQAPTSLDNAAIVHDVAIGLAPPVVIALIQSSPGKYDISAPALLELTRNHVPADVVAAMVKKQAAAPPPSLRDQPFGKQVSPTLILGQPFHRGGVDISLIRATNLHVAAWVVTTDSHYHYERVALAVRNTGSKPVDIDPSSQIRGIRDGTECQGCVKISEYPMDDAQVAKLASKIRRKEQWAILATGVLGTMEANTYSQYSPTNSYLQSRSDNQTDAEAAQSNQEYSDTTSSQFFETTLQPGELVGGLVYFAAPKAPKNSHGPTFPDMLLLTVNGITYQLSLD